MTRFSIPNMKGARRVRAQLLTLRQCRAHLGVPVPCFACGGTGAGAFVPVCIPCDGTGTLTRHPSQPTLSYHVRVGNLIPNALRRAPSGKILFYGFTKSTVQAFARAVGWEYVP